MTRQTDPMTGLSLRPELHSWIQSRPSSVECLEIIADHFFRGGEQLLATLKQTYPLFVHGLGFSLGSPGPLDKVYLNQFKRVVEQTEPQWISEHVAFTKSDEIDLGHLNQVVPNHATLDIISDHAKELMDHCQKPLILENVTSFVQVHGTMTEPEFLNRLCDKAECGILLDVTNLFINSRNHGFDPIEWLDSLEMSHVCQLHIVGYSVTNGVWHDRHAEPIQDDLLQLFATVLERANVRAVIIERDVDVPGPQILEHEMQRLREAVGAVTHDTAALTEVPN